MKKMLGIIALVVATFTTGHTQIVNWRSLQENQPNLVQLDFGLDYGTTVQLGYSRAFDWFRPVVLGLDFSSPMGNVLVDDFKVRLGGQMEVLQIGGFSATVRIQSNFRRYENQMVEIVSFGSDLGLVTGYYASTWHVAGEFGFDKSIVSHFGHSDIMRSSFPAIRDGWFLPTGGNYYYGIQAGKTLGDTYALSLRVGATDAQFDDENSMLPYYIQAGLGIRF